MRHHVLGTQSKLGSKRDSCTSRISSEVALDCVAGTQVVLGETFAAPTGLKKAEQPDVRGMAKAPSHSADQARRRARTEAIPLVAAADSIPVLPARRRRFGRPAVYAVDVNHLRSNDNGDTEAHLYRDGLHYARARLPAVFPIEGGEIEVATSAFGIRRCHYVTAARTEQQLVPDPRSAEGRRARLDREHPALSRWIGVFSLVLVAVPLLFALPQTLEAISRFPPLADRFGVFESPVEARGMAHHRARDQRCGGQHRARSAPAVQPLAGPGGELTGGSPSLAGRLSFRPPWIEGCFSRRLSRRPG